MKNVFWQCSIVGTPLDEINRLNESSAHPDFCASKFLFAVDTEEMIVKAWDLGINKKYAAEKIIAALRSTQALWIGPQRFTAGENGKTTTLPGGFTATENVAKFPAAAQK